MTLPDASSTDERQALAEQSNRVGWLELFFDLVFVTALGVVNEAVRDQDLLSHVFAILMATAGIFVIWVLVTLVHSRFPDDSAVRRGLMVLVMIGLTVGSLGIDERVGVTAAGSQLGFALALAAIGAMVWHAPHPAMRRSAVVLRGVIAIWIGALTCLVAAVVPLSDTLEYLVMGVVTIAALVFLDMNFSRNLDHLHPVRPAHLMERFGLLSLIVLGEGFTVLVVALREDNAELDPRFFLLTFVLVFLLWQMFFDGVLSEHRPFRRWKTAVFGQYLLIIGIVAMLDMMADLSASLEGESGLGPRHYAVAATIAFLGFAVLAVAREAGRAELLTHLGLAAVNLVLVGFVVTADATGLEWSAVIGALLVAIDAAFVISMARRQNSVES